MKKNMRYCLFIFLFFPAFVFAQVYEGVYFVTPKDKESTETSEEQNKRIREEQNKRFLVEFLTQAEQQHKRMTMEEGSRASTEMLKVRKSIRRKDKQSLQALDRVVLAHGSLMDVLKISQPAAQFFPAAEAALQEVFVAYKNLEKINPAVAQAIFQPLNHYYWMEYQDGRFSFRDGRPLLELKDNIQNEELKNWISRFDGSF